MNSPRQCYAPREDTQCQPDPATIVSKQVRVIFPDGLPGGLDHNSKADAPVREPAPQAVQPSERSAGPDKRSAAVVFRADHDPSRRETVLQGVLGGAGLAFGRDRAAGPGRGRARFVLSGDSPPEGTS